MFLFGLYCNTLVFAFNTSYLWGINNFIYVSKLFHWVILYKFNWS
jgi:hypothetical protein